MAAKKSPTRRTFIRTAGLAGAGLACGPFLNLSGGIAPARGKAMSSSAYKKVIVLGIDGLDPKIAGQLMAQGRMPNLAKLAQEGTFSPLATVDPPQSPVCWSGMATGSNPGRHGIYDFIIRNPKTMLPDLSLVKLKSSLFGGGEYINPVSGDTFWIKAAQAGQKATVVRWPVTFPAQGKGVRMLAGLGTPDVKGTLGRYAFYTDKDLDDTHSRGAIVKVKFQGGWAETHVYGPMTASFGRKSAAKVELRLKRRGDKLIFQGAADFSLAVGQWSDWLRFKFDLGFASGSVRGMGRFYLTSLDPLELYLTPIQIDPDKPSFPLSNPEDYAAELAKAVGGPYATLGMPEETKGLSEERIPDGAFWEMCSSIHAERAAMYDFELGRHKEGLLAFVFDTSDRIQHMFYRLKDPAHPLFDPKLAAKLGRAIDDHYAVMDGIIGKTLAACGDDTALIICSDHGIGSYTRSVNLNLFLAQAGYLAFKAHDPKDPGELFAHLDWKKTQAYALGFGSVYLNLEGREKDGLVKPGDQAKELAHRIAADMMKIKDGSKQVIAAVHHKEDIYSGPLTQQAPDLVVGYHLPYRVSWTTAVGGQGPELFEDNTQKWSGDHCVDSGFVPGTVASNLKLNIGDRPRQTQLADTVMKLLGLERDKEMDPGWA